MPAFKPSPFLDPGPTVSAGSLAVLHLKRDLLIPTILQDASRDDEGNEVEEKITNTRFGSFPHSTLISQPWGTQVRASNVDTGSRGKKAAGKKRKRDAADAADGEAEDSREASSQTVATVASSGFIHVVPPTPEAWTISLPHRTQVVYTPDASYVLQRLQVRPGDTIIEAGAGSGSFTHAAARAVFSGYPDAPADAAPRKRRLGKVYSFEYHAPRAEQLRQEIAEHGLDGIVQITHRDVYQDGFCVEDGEPQADAIFLDLPAPWIALKHLTRTALSAKTTRSIDTGDAESSAAGTPLPDTTNTDPAPAPPPFRSPLNPHTPTRLCTFSPCIEQVQRTVATMRQLGWLEIGTVEVLHRRLDVRRDRVGLTTADAGRGANAATAANVDEALRRLREVDARFRNRTGGLGEEEGEEEELEADDGRGKKGKRSQQQQQKQGQDATAASVPSSSFRHGRLVTRTEPEIKTHTSYLTFAVLPRAWTERDEARARRRRW